MNGPRKGVPVLAAALLLAAAWVSFPPGGEGMAREGKEVKARAGKVVGVLTKKGENFIEVRADGEERARRYVPRWIGGLPADGGGLEKGMLKTFRGLKVGSRLEVEWAFEERFRAVKVKVLREPDDK